MATASGASDAGVSNPWSPAPSNEKDVLEKVVSHVHAWETGVGRDFKERCERMWSLYRGFKRFRNVWEAAGPNDRDGVLYDAKRAWGANLHIPIAFQTVETMLPRAIAQRPRMLYLPRQQRWEENLDHVRATIEAQQEQIDCELIWQDVMRAGFIYGLGPAKVLWRKEFCKARVTRPHTFKPSTFVVGAPQSKLKFDDPDFEAINVRDFMWDQYGGSVRALEWAVHRTWLSSDAVQDRISTGTWNTESAKLLIAQPQMLEAMASTARYDETYDESRWVNGFTGTRGSATAAGQKIHEVLEFHDGEEVLTVLDRQVLVQQGENPCYGELPFMAYRPTPIESQLAGIGEIEPIEHLSRELDTLRSQRRDAATIALCAGYAYDANAIDEDDLVFGPAAAIRVTNANPAEALTPLPVRDVPGSGYREEDAILRDWQQVSGISDPDGAGTPSSTATESMLVQAAVSKRIENKSRRFEVEIIRRQASLFLRLNQRMILSDREYRTRPEGPTDPTNPDVQRWAWFKVGPGELMGDFEIIPEGGTLAAENVQQDRNDAQMLMQLTGQDPNVNPRVRLLYVLSKLGIDEPESWLTQQAPPLPPQVLDTLQKMGVRPDLIQRAVQSVQQSQPPMLPPAQGDEESDPAQGAGPQAPPVAA